MSLLSLEKVCSPISLSGFTVGPIDYTLAPLKKYAIMGCSGAGKTTLLKMMAGLTQHESGTILFENKICKGPEKTLMPGVKGIAYLSQSFDLWNNYKIEDILSYDNKLSKEESKLLYQVCRIDHLMLRNSKQLSGGEKQRIALARLLVAKPSLLLLDEPFSNLDNLHKAQLKEVIDSICKTFQITVLLASHHPEDILPWADELLILERGKITQQGNPKTIYNQPKDLYSAALTGYYSFINKKQSLALGLDDTAKILRPHHIIIDKKGNIKAEVIQCQYFGSYYLLHLKIKDSILITYSQQDYAVGSLVSIFIHTDKIKMEGEKNTL